MTDILEKAFAQAAKLPRKQQDDLGAWILAELASEHKWERHLQNPLMLWLNWLKRHLLNTARAGRKRLMLISYEISLDEAVS